MPTLRQLREAAGMTRLEVAIRMNVTPGTIYNWERGIREPRGRQLQQLAKLYGVSADDILLPEAPDKGKAAA